MYSYRDMEDRLSKLYDEQQKIEFDKYIECHFRHRAAILNRINGFYKYKPFIGSTILDWGCRHASDSCLIRMSDGDKVKIWGCDIFNENKYEVFHRFAGIKYDCVTHPFALPYEDNFFDTVIGSGVIEHVPNDGESIKDLWRILKPSGHLILTYIPNLFSYTEYGYKIMKKERHKRKYSIRWMKHFLLHRGFETIYSNYHQIIPTQMGGFSFCKNKITVKVIDMMWNLNNVLEKIWPINRLSTNIIIVAKKHLVM